MTVWPPSDRGPGNDITLALRGVQWRRHLPKSAVKECPATTSRGSFCQEPTQAAALWVLTVAEYLTCQIWDFTGERHLHGLPGAWRVHPKGTNMHHSLFWWLIRPAPRYQWEANMCGPVGLLQLLYREVNSFSGRPTGTPAFQTSRMGTFSTGACTTMMVVNLWLLLRKRFISNYTSRHTLTSVGMPSARRHGDTIEKTTRPNEWGSDVVLHRWSGCIEDASVNADLTGR